MQDIVLGTLPPLAAFVDVYNFLADLHDRRMPEPGQDLLFLSGPGLSETE